VYERTSQGIKSVKTSSRAEASSRQRPEDFPLDGNVKTGWDAERQPDPGKGNALKGQKPHERYRHETRPGRPGEERSAERLRKPESAAQPGEVSPVLVASPG
jgi:hypothetical protein